MLAILLFASSYSVPVIAQERVALDVIISDQRHDTSQPAPVVLALHSRFSSAKAFRARAGLDRVARELGLIVAYPQAGSEGWGATGAMSVTPLIAALRKDPRTIDQPVVVVGHSDGGDIALQIACESPQQLAGLGIVSTKLTKSTECPRAKPLPAIFIHGTADPIAPHGGNSSQLSAGETIEAWVSRNRCRDDVRVTRLDRNASDAFSAVVRSYRRCQAALEHIQLLGAGHGWPTGSKGGSRGLGPGTPDLRAGVTILGFFKAFLAR